MRRRFLNTCISQAKIKVSASLCAGKESPHHGKEERQKERQEKGQKVSPLL